MKEKLKIGLLINDFYIPAWAYEMVNQIEKSNYASIALIVKKKT